MPFSADAYASNAESKTSQIFMAIGVRKRAFAGMPSVGFWTVSSSNVAVFSSACKE
jgi:uncharacterized membrane protein